MTINDPKLNVKDEKYVFDMNGVRSGTREMSGLRRDRGLPCEVQTAASVCFTGKVKDQRTFATPVMDCYCKALSLPSLLFTEVFYGYCSKVYRTP